MWEYIAPGAAGAAAALFFTGLVMYGLGERIPFLQPKRVGAFQSPSLAILAGLTGLLSLVLESALVGRKLAVVTKPSRFNLLTFIWKNRGLLKGRHLPVLAKPGPFRLLTFLRSNRNWLGK
jgi:hypothetical protein